MPSKPNYEPETPRYRAFISYSHADRACADELHKALERYHVPRRLVGVETAAGPVPARIAPVFLDRVDLAANTDIDATIANALRSSHSLIVICSPSATRSQRVINEILSFRQLTSGRIFPLIVAGRPDAVARGGLATEECFPAPLRAQENLGSQNSRIPLAADLRPGNGGWQEAILKLVAGIIEVNLDQLRQRDTQRRRKRWISATAIAFTAVMASSALALYAWGQRNAALQSQARLLAEVADQRLNDADVAGAQDIILHVLKEPRYKGNYNEAAINVFQESRAADQQLAILSGHRGFVRFASYSPDGARIVTASDDKTARIWDSLTGVQILVLSGHAGGVNSAAYSPDGSRIVTSSDDKTARIWDAHTGEELVLLSGHTTFVKSAAYSPDGTRIVTASWDKTVRVWDARSGALIRVLAGHGSAVCSAAYSPDGSRIVTASHDHTARIWDAHTGMHLVDLTGHRAYVKSAAFSPDGTQIVTASYDRTARVWDAHTGMQMSVLSGHADRIESAAFSPDGTHVVTASLDGTARVWNTQMGEQRVVLPGHGYAFSSAKYSPDGTRIVTAGGGNTARIWDARTGAQLGIVSGHETGVTSAAFAPDGAQFVTTSGDKAARIWNTRTGAPMTVLHDPSGGLNCAAYSPDGSRIVTASDDRTARVWDTRTGSQIAVLSGHVGSVRWAAYSPDGGRIVTASWDKTARIWDALSGVQLAILSGHHDSVSSVDFSPDGTRIATASYDKTARIWDASSGMQLLVLSGHRGVVESVVFSPDGSRVATASLDKTVRIWDARTGTQLAVLTGHGDIIETVAYSPDGTYIVTASDDNTARIWDARVPANLATQVTWTEASQADSLSDFDLKRLGIEIEPTVVNQRTNTSECDQASGAFYDPARRAQGVETTGINVDIAISACSREIAIPRHAVRADYQMGRALAAGHDFNGAMKEFEMATARGYSAADIDVGLLLTSRVAGKWDPYQAVSVDERAWRSGVAIAAFELGQLYEFGATDLGVAMPTELRPDEEKAWSWYQKGADAMEPNALARFAEREQKNALTETDRSKRNAFLLHAFTYYAQATCQAQNEGWPDDVWREWRYRRATLARLLAREGMMQQVADAYNEASTRHQHF